MRHARRTVPALVCTALVLLAGCGGAGRGAEAGIEGDAGPPQRGGSAVVLQMTEPRSLDPAVMTSAYAGNGVVGNSLYGYLVHNDIVTGEISYGLAEDLSSADGGTTWTLTLRDGLRFSDGTPLDAAAVKFNWDRLKDPTLGSSAVRVAGLVDTTTVTGARTLTFTLRVQVANFADSVATSPMNWVARPAALQAGQQAFDAAPIGAGPFVLESWTRQDRMVLTRNPTYYDPERPYLDAITLRTTTDENQRLSTLTSGGGDVMISSNPQAQDRAEASGFGVTREQHSGGNALLFNTAVAPFDDPRAREAVAAAIDLDAINAAVFAGKGTVPTTLFRPESPLFADIPLTRHDRARAQSLFDELAAEGRPLTFAMTSYPTNESRVVVEAMQAQLSAYTNVAAQVEILDFAGAGAKQAQRQFQSIIGSPGIFSDPGFALWTSLHSAGAGNYTAVRDPELDIALDTGRTETDPATRRAAYETVQRRLTELHPFLLFTRSGAATIAAEQIHGVQMFGSSTLMTDRLWTEQDR